MNLLKKEIEKPKEGEFFLNNFRSYQYSLLRDFFELMVLYLSSQSNNYLILNNIKIREIPSYIDVYESSLLEITVDVINTLNNAKKTLIKLIIPNLVDDTFFVIGGDILCPHNLFTW